MIFEVIDYRITQREPYRVTVEIHPDSSSPPVQGDVIAKATTGHRFVVLMKVKEYTFVIVPYSNTDSMPHNFNGSWESKLNAKMEL
jgi:hypothetical protein